MGYLILLHLQQVILFIKNSYSTYTSGQSDVIAEIFTADCVTFKRNQFIVDNFNDKVVHFQLTDITGTQIEDAHIKITKNTVWTLTFYI